MAGGKQTPRQRMIGMMYLVLTAMLALQVSSSIMDKFIFLNNSLEHALEGAKSASESALKQLIKQVEKEGNTPQGRERIKRAEALKKETASLINYIEQIKTRIANECGGGKDPKTGVVKDPKDETKVEVLMIGNEAGGKKGLGYELEAKLNGFAKYLVTDYKDLGVTAADFPPLAEGNEKNPIYQNDPVQKGKNFAQASFGQTPVVAAMALLSQKQNEIIRYEQEVLKKLGAGEFSNEIKFDKILAFASAESDVVALGSEYKASLILTATSSRANARMSANGAAVRPNKDGFGEVTIVASAKGEQAWKGSITINNRGKDTTFVIEKKFTVVEPVLLVTAGQGGFPLYRNCANPLETAVPALGANYKPSFTVTNGTAVPGGRVGDVTIYPGAGTSVKMTVSSGGKVVGVKDFRVNPVPPPKVFLANAGGMAIPLSDAINMPPTIRIKAESDETFRNTLPKEANYAVISYEVIHFRGGRALGRYNATGENFNTGAIAARSGDGVQINIKSVQRINSRGEREAAPVLQPYLSFFVK